MKNSPNQSRLRDRYPLIFFLFFYLLWSLLTYRDFGMTFDESGVYSRGIGLAHYLADDDFLGFLHKSVPDDGLVIYDHLYGMLLSILNPSGDIDYYHWLNLFFASLIFVAAFEVLLRQTQKPWLAFLGPLFLILTPRFLGDIPANPKDMPFTVFYFLSLAGIYFFSRNPKTNPLLKCLVLGLLFGLAQCCRSVGFTLYGVYLLYEFYLYKGQGKHPRGHWRGKALETAGTLLIVFVLSNFLMVATWPYLGANYFRHLWEMVSLSRNFLWLNDVLFLGREIPSTQLPWFYLPVWIVLTTPWFILFFLGASFFFVRDKIKNSFLMLMTIALGLNLGLVLVLRPVLYDGLRHFLFLLPILDMIAALCAIEFILRVKVPSVKRLVFAAVGLNILVVVFHLFRLHPYEYIYFNELIGGVKGAEGKLDNDYWGASFKEAVEWLARNEIKDENRIYKINGSGNAYQIFTYFLPNMRWVDKIEDADFYISYTRDNKHKAVDASKVIHVVEREGVPLNFVYKLK